MAEEHEKCPDCGTPLMDLERRLEVTAADASHRHHAVDCVAVLRERIQTMRDVINAANDILLDTHSFDIEHAIKCHADTLPEQFRSVATGADKAIEVLQMEIQRDLPDPAMPCCSVEEHASNDQRAADATKRAQEEPCSTNHGAK